MECILNGLDQHGWVSVPGCMNHDDSIRLAQECLASCENGDFVSAGVGRGQGLEVRESIRQDRVKWIQPGEESVEQKIYLAKVDGMRLAINERFFSASSISNVTSRCIPKADFTKLISIVMPGAVLAS
jgi:SM-20-related protein